MNMITPYGTNSIDLKGLPLDTSMRIILRNYLQPCL